MKKRSIIQGNGQVTLEELMQDGREIRAKLLKEMYGIEPDDEQE